MGIFVSNLRPFRSGLLKSYFICRLPIEKEIYGGIETTHNETKQPITITTVSIYIMVEQ